MGDYKMKKKGEIGIGTLIIFIAMILVAAIAAGVLLQTASSLQNKALLTGSRSESQVATSLSPMLVYAEDGSTGTNTVDKIYMKFKLSPGSDSVRFSDMLVEFSLKNASNDMVYNSTADCTNVPPDGAGFAIDYLIQGNNWADSYLQRGDVAKLCFTTSRAIEEDETVSLTIVPKIGNPTIVETAMPDIITEQRITIFP